MKRILLLMAFVSSMTYAQTKLMQQPAIGKDKIAFIYAEDLWTANLDGTNPTRLTVDEGIESSPVFSPDGKWIAFNAEYDGNRDVFVVSASGGTPKRLTWHPYTDRVKDFTPNGKSVLFMSQRSVHSNRLGKLFTVPVTGGQVTELPIPCAFDASYSNDGKTLAYTPNSEAFNMWKNYRGGRVSKIWVYNVNNHKIQEIPHIKGGNNDSNPEMMDGKVYFKSDRDGEFNLYSYDVVSKAIKKLTDYSDYQVTNLSAAHGKVIFEQAGRLHLLDAASGKISDININIKTDLLELRPRYVSGENYARSISISPSGARTVVDFRGDIVTVPAKKGDPNNLTNTSGVHEKYPEWSPNGKYIAYFSDASGEYAMHIKDTQSNIVNRIPLNGTGFYASIHWSPNSKKVTFVDNGRNFYVMDISTKKMTKIAQDEMFFPGDSRDLYGSWSHDSKWISYTKITNTMFEQAYVYSLADNKSFSVSDGLANVSNPVFDPSGKYLYMFASTDAGPLVHWFDQSNLDMNASVSIHAVTLQKSVSSPLTKENDVEKVVVEKSAVVKSNNKKKKPEATAKPSSKPDLKIDWDGFERRIINLPVRAGNYSNLSAPTEGEIYYIARTDSGSNVKKYSFKDRKEKEIMPANYFVIAASGKKMLYVNRGKWGIADLGAKPKDPPLNLNGISVKIDPKKEWRNMFNEVWRVNRDYFYDPNMHGADWPAMKKKYEPFLADVTCKNDLYRVMQWMCSEIAVGHHRFDSSGDRMNNPKRVSVGLLGADYAVKNNRHQIKKIYGGLNWTLNVRSPLTEPGVDIKEGDYIISVNGNNVSANDNLHSFFENTAGKIVNLKVSSKADGPSARNVKVTPISNESAIRNRAWVEDNIKKVDEATNGQVAYVYVPNTTTAGHQHFKRYFFPQAHKKAIIVDERYNGGGSLADYYIDILKRPLNAHWKFRYGNDLKSPSASIQGPKVLIVNETSSSGGDYFPYLFRQAKLGTIVGKRTWGGLVGVLGYPQLIDGGIVTSPNVAFYNENGYRIENEGVAPDIDVEQLPELVVKGRDPQLEKAIEVALKGLKENPPKEMKAPAFPTRARK